MMTPLTVLSAETLDDWSTRQADTLEAVSLLIEGVQDDNLYNHGPSELGTALQAAGLLLAEAKVMPRMLRDEAKFAFKMAKARKKGLEGLS